MNTLKIERLLAEKYKYKPLPEELSQRYREFFRENIPEWLPVAGGNIPLYTSRGTIIAYSYRRIVIGDYGAFIEFDTEPYNKPFIVKPGQEYRVSDNRYSQNVKYEWYTVDDGSNVKIYYQKRQVNYADYKTEMFYVSVHEVFGAGGILYDIGQWDMFNMISSAWHGKQYYFLESDDFKKVYSRKSGKTITMDDAVMEFLSEITPL